MRETRRKNIKLHKYDYLILAELHMQFWLFILSATFNKKEFMPDFLFVVL